MAKNDKPIQMGRGHNMGPRPKLDNPLKIFGRLIKYSYLRYPVPFVIVLICLFYSSFAQVRGMMFLQVLIDDYIVPLKGVTNPDYQPLLGAIGKIGLLYLSCAIATFTMNKIMVYITQGTMRNLRIELFEHMEKLPIKYFDTHSHGDIICLVVSTSLV